MSKKIILCVDDQRMVLYALVCQLESEFRKDYVIEIAETASDAWDIIREAEENNQKIALIISDWLMPIQKGDEFLINVSKQYPDLPLIMLSGQIDDASLKKTQNYSNLKAFIRKPWSKNELIENIRKFAL
ncbi:MAG: response regulator [Bacteroidia bacterium]|jgi:CheY-like chemotaxis protein|nr:MAG: response regulator [Bacteroidia bacterium]